MLSIRTIMALSLATLAVGCGEAETTRFVPAAADPGATARVPSLDPDRSATPPKNIATH